jgi:hypothetical protein
MFGFPHQPQDLVAGVSANKAKIEAEAKRIMSA